MRRLIANWQTSERQAMRIGFGSGLVLAARENDDIVALSADLMESVGFGEFAAEFGYPRCIEVGVAEQNLVTVASGLAHAGRKPYAASYAAFSPGRAWEQIRTTICLNEQPVVLIGTHAGLNVGPDGATHQMLEDIALMRSLPNMTVLAPGDAVEARLVAQAIARHRQPVYIRLPREKTPLFLNDEFELGRAYTLREGSDVTLFGTGTMTYQLLLAAEKLAPLGVQAEVVHVPTIKPLDEQTILTSVSKTGRAVTAEEGQIAGGFGGAIAELLCRKMPMPLLRLGVDDCFGQSGTMDELWHEYGLDDESIVRQSQQFVATVPQYRPGF